MNKVNKLLMKWICIKNYPIEEHIKLDMKLFGYTNPNEFPYKMSSNLIEKYVGDIIEIDEYGDYRVSYLGVPLYLSLSFEKYYKEYFIPLAEYRDQRINEILDL